MADVLNEHVTLEVECIDRMSLNVYQPRLQYDLGVVNFFRFHRGHTFASSALREPIRQAFIANVERFVKRRSVPLITFRKGERQEDIVLPYRLAAKERERVQLIFHRRVSKRTPGRFRTRVLTEGVTPSLHVDYKHSKIKPDHKEGRALRTETTINDPRDFGIGKRLQNLSALRKVGFDANRRSLNVQRISHDAILGEAEFQRLNSTVEVSGQRAGPLRFGDPKVQTLLSVLLLFRLLARGFSNHDVREHWAPLLGTTPDSLTSGQMTYQLRRLRLHGLIERIPKTHRYQLTASGAIASDKYTKIYNRVLRPELATLTNSTPSLKT